jgi:hypothetical protein
MSHPNPRETFNRLTTILDEVVDALDAYDQPVGSQTIEPSSPAGLDHCCPNDDSETGGHAYIRVVRMHMVNPFPQQTLDPTQCRNIGALVEVGVFRCAQTMDEAGSPPPDEQITALAELVTADMSIMYSVLSSHTPDYALYPLVLDTYTSIEVEGGCAGGVWQFWMDVAVCPPVPTSPSSP